MMTPDRPTSRAAAAVALRVWEADIADALSRATWAEVAPLLFASDLAFEGPALAPDLMEVVGAAGDRLIAMTRFRTERPCEPSSLERLHRMRAGPRHPDRFPFRTPGGDYDHSRNVEVVAGALKIATPDARSSYLSALRAWCIDPISKEDPTLHWLAAQVLVASVTGVIDGKELDS